ncbi:hypothetical protein [Marinomonas sp. TW1]|nr:hypothetical protein [Marinomonas sp. TW1]
MLLFLLLNEYFRVMQIHDSLLFLWELAMLFVVSNLYRAKAQGNDVET